MEEEEKGEEEKEEVKEDRWKWKRGGMWKKKRRWRRKTKKEVEKEGVERWKQCDSDL